MSCLVRKAAAPLQWNSLQYCSLISFVFGIKKRNYDRNMNSDHHQTLVHTKVVGAVYRPLLRWIQLGRHFVTVYRAMPALGQRKIGQRCLFGFTSVAYQKFLSQMIIQAESFIYHSGRKFVHKRRGISSSLINYSTGRFWLGLFA